MRDFILAHKDTLKFVLNYHSYGNMFLVPYSGTDESFKLTSEQEKIYNELHDGAEFPKHLAFGTAK